MSWRRNILLNGLTVLLYPRESANTTQLSVAVEYGSNQEPKENAGVAHFLEHMIAGGSTKRIQLSRSIENSGGILDLYTDHEHMMSTMDFLPEKLADASNILSQLLFSGDFKEEKFSSERKIILNELAEALDDPAERIEDLLLKSLFKEHPVGRPVGGYPKTVKQLTLDQLSHAHEINYVPENMILILTGGFSEKSVETALQNFADKKTSERFSKKSYPLEAAKPKPLVVQKKAGIAQTYLSVGARTVCSSHKDAAVLDLVSAVLSGGTSSRLFVELREKHALTYDVNSDHNKGLDFGYFNVNCAVKDKNLGKAKNMVLAEFSKLRTQKVPVEELERSKNLIVGGILRGMDNPQEALEIIAYLEMQYRSEQALVDYIAKVKAVTSDNIMDVANAYLKEDMLSTVILQPTK
ncbi:MAG: insulinase family protein [Chloroflexi bacterium]|nr:insulinase family protein [Chloroflexota bacterium]